MKNIRYLAPISLYDKISLNLLQNLYRIVKFCYPNISDIFEKTTKTKDI